MKLKIAVCDDDASQREYLIGVLDAWSERNRHLTEVKQYTQAKEFLFDYSAEKDFDILLLDIEMPGMNGIELAKKVLLYRSSLSQDITNTSATALTYRRSTIC